MLVADDEVFGADLLLDALVLVEGPVPLPPHPLPQGGELFFKLTHLCFKTLVPGRNIPLFPVCFLQDSTPLGSKIRVAVLKQSLCTFELLL